MSTATTERVAELLTKFCQQEHIQLASDINGDTDLRSLGLSSMLFIKFVVRLEIEFDVDFDDENMDVTTFITVSDIGDYIDQLTVG